MIIVQPLFFLFVKQTLVNQPGINKAKCQRFEPQKLSEFGFFCRNSQHQIFSSDTIFIGAIHAGFIRSDHSCLQGGRVFIHSDILWTFMHIQEMPYSMTGSMSVIQSKIPHGFARQNIQLRTAGIHRKFSHCQINMPFEHQCIIFLLLCGGFSKGNGSGNIGSTFQVLSAGVQQKNSFGHQCRGCFGTCRVMNNCTMTGITGNGIETFTNKVFLFCPETEQFFGYRYFGEMPVFNIFFEPDKEFGQCHTILNHGFPHTGYLHFIFQTFQFEYRRHPYSLFTFSGYCFKQRLI